MAVSVGSIMVPLNEQGCAGEGLEDVIGHSPALKSALVEVKTSSTNQFHRARPCGDRYRQGTDCPRHSQDQPVLPASLRESESLSHSL